MEASFSHFKFVFSNKWLFCLAKNDHGWGAFPLSLTLFVWGECVRVCLFCLCNCTLLSILLSLQGIHTEFIPFSLDTNCTRPTNETMSFPSPFSSFINHPSSLNNKLSNLPLVFTVTRDVAVWHERRKAGAPGLLHTNGLWVLSLPRYT